MQLVGVAVCLGLYSFVAVSQFKMRARVWGVRCERTRRSECERKRSEHYQGNTCVSRCLFTSLIDVDRLSCEQPSILHGALGQFLSAQGAVAALGAAVSSSCVSAVARHRSSGPVTEADAFRAL